MLYWHPVYTSIYLDSNTHSRAMQVYTLISETSTLFQKLMLCQFIEASSFGFNFLQCLISFADHQWVQYLSLLKARYILNEMENVSTVAESLFSYTSLLSPFQAKRHWHELYINLREWIFFLTFFFCPLFFFLPWQQLWHIGSVRNEKYSCRHAILVMKSQLDLLHDWFCNFLFL